MALLILVGRGGNPLGSHSLCVEDNTTVGFSFSAVKSVLRDNPMF